MTQDVQIRLAQPSDKEAISQVIAAAFGEEVSTILGLVTQLMADPTAQPSLSLVATVGTEAGEGIVGYVLFSNAWFEGGDRSESIALLAPLCVHPNYQRQGIGGRLIEDGIQRLIASGTELIFVLGHPSYYPRYRFSPALRQGFEPTYPLLPKNENAWMVRELKAGAADVLSGKVICADALHSTQHWRE